MNKLLLSLLSALALSLPVSSMAQTAAPADAPTGVTSPSQAGAPENAKNKKHKKKKHKKKKHKKAKPA